jgi:cytochrome b subunit of formate dehydrogenase
MLRYDVLTFWAGGSVWLKQWAEVNGEEGKNPNVGKYIGVYFGFGIGSAALVVVQTLILWIFCSIEVSRTDVLGVFHHANAIAAAKLSCITGIEETSRENGFCHF